VRNNRELAMMSSHSVQLDSDLAACEAQVELGTRDVI